MELKDRLVAEITRLFEDVLGTQVMLVSPKVWLVGTNLELTASLPEDDWQTIIHSLEYLAETSHMVHGVWTSGADLLLFMGLDVWQSTRLDRLSGSRVFSMTNNSPLDSHDRMQRIKISRSTSATFLQHDLASYNLPEGALREYQAMVHFLRSSRRINTGHLTALIMLLVEKRVE